jgi:hypothetical protein
VLPFCLRSASNRKIMSFFKTSSEESTSDESSSKESSSDECLQDVADDVFERSDQEDADVP